tara:strand:- start:5469 stop:6680 length:1212 start_codon:yes stop_codon:yes gene_type:complete
VIDERGFALSSEGFVVSPEGCKVTFRQELAAIDSLNKKNSEISEKWGQRFDRCSQKLNPEELLRWQLASSPSSEWEAILKKSSLPKSRVDELLAISQKRVNFKDKVERLRGIIEQILNFKSSDNKAKDGILLQRFGRDLTRFPNGVLKQFGLLLLASEAKNRSLLKSLIEEVVHWEQRVIPFYGIDMPLSEETWKSVDILLINATAVIDDSVLLRAFGTRVFQFIERAKLPKFSDLVDTTWSLSELRKLANSAWYAPLIPAFWYSQLAGRVSTNEIGIVVDSLLERVAAKNWNSHDLWVFSDWLPGNTSKRDDIFEAVKELSKREEPYLKELLVRFSENSILRRELESRKIIPSKALFKLKRDFYTDLLKQGRQVDYALYQLTALGDEDKDYLWWFVFNPFRY